MPKKKKKHTWLNEKTLWVVCLLILIFGAYLAWQNIEEGPSPTGGAIYIKADGSVEPLTANITSADSVTYTFTDNNYGSIILEMDNIVVDGAGYTLEGAGIGTGVNLTEGSNVTITNLKIKDFKTGIFLYSASHNVLSQNNLTNTVSGIILCESSNNILSGNDMTNNNYGIILEQSSSNNILSGNDMTNNNYGIVLDGSSNNTISGNTFFNCGLFVWESYGNVVVDNLVNNKPLVYLEGVSDYVVDNAGQVILINCTNIFAEDLNLSNATIGIQLWATNNTHITNNSIANNYFHGIFLYSASHNVLSQNNLTNNKNGIVLDGSSNNSNYHNNFIDNAEHVKSYASTNVWDGGYPSIGNYWSNYAGVDLDHDGIGDSWHEIDGNNTDHYPLMGLCYSFNTTVGKHVNVISNSIIESFYYFESNSTIIMHLSSATASQAFGFCRVTIPKSLMSPPYTVKIDDGSTAVLIFNGTIYDNDTHRCIYFAYEHSEHSEHKVEIIP
jgi:parallel beta-helix repeat protein